MTETLAGTWRPLKWGNRQRGGHPPEEVAGDSADTTDKWWDLPICILLPQPLAPPQGKAGQVLREQGQQCTASSKLGAPPGCNV